MSRRIPSYDAANRQAARLILADVERYAGLMDAWARLWCERHGAATRPISDRRQMKLMGMEASWREAA